MILLSGWVLSEILMCLPGKAKDKLYPTMRPLGRLVLVPPDRLQNFQYVFFC